MKSIDLKIGDRVTLVDQDIKGKIIKINGNLITILSSFNLELNYQKEKLIKIEEDPSLKKLYQEFDSNFISSKSKDKKNKIHSSKTSILEIDLHAENLFKNFYTSNLSNPQIILRQLEVAREALELVSSNKIYKKLILIHGNGKRVLREKIHSLIKENYSNLEYFDASYQKYGSGATEVRFKF